jgi:hypothetical protein
LLAAHLAAVIGRSWPAAGESFAGFDAKVAAPFHAFCSRNIRLATPAGAASLELGRSRGGRRARATGIRQAHPAPDERSAGAAERDRRIRGLRLSDGGLYDNMGIEPVWKSHAVVLVSDGGSTFDGGYDRGLFWRLNRYIEIMGRQGGAIRRRWLVASFVEGALRGTF